MATVDIDGNDFPVYADVDFADIYLSGDAQRAVAWAARDATSKARGLISGTRLLQRLCWTDGVPSTDDPVLAAIAEATSLMAADILAKPSLGDSASTATDVKRAKAGPAEVEFFRNFESTPLPTAAWQILLDTGLLCESAGITDSSPYISGSEYPSRFDPDFDDISDDPALGSYWYG